jgi:hypothetical protein
VLGWAGEVEDEREVVLERRHIELGDGRHQGLPAVACCRAPRSTAAVPRGSRVRRQQHRGAKLHHL